MQIDSPYPPNALEPGIRSHRVDNGNGLMCHVLEAGDPTHPCVLLLHGFPELAYSWRKIILPLVQAGFHVIAPDQRGYGRTAGSDDRFDGDVASFRLFNLVRDAMGVLFAFGHEKAACVVGHDFGSSVAAWCAVIRPDVFSSVVLMSAPFAGTPEIPLSGSDNKKSSIATIDHAALAALTPPRKHYQWYYSTAEANANMHHCPQGVAAFLRAYYHHKSADWENNKPRPLESWSADSLSQLPTYYVMLKSAGMAETVAPEMPDDAFVESHQWLPESELGIYATEYSRTGFQGGLNWYRCGTNGEDNAELQTFSGLTIDVPSMFIAGASDWGIHQKPGSFEAMQSRRACTNMVGCHLIDGAGHWVQQEQPEAVARLLVDFLK